MMASFGCKDSANTGNFVNIQKKFFELKSFQATVDIEIINNKNITKYTVNQYYIYPNKFRVEVIYPEFLKNLVFINNEKNAWVSNSKVNINDTYYWEMVLGLKGNNTFITEFFSNYVKAEESKMVIKDNKYILSTVIFSGNTYMETERLTISRNGYPEKLEIFDQGGKTKLILNYREFKMNSRIDEKVFQI